MAAASGKLAYGCLVIGHQRRHEVAHRREPFAQPRIRRGLAELLRAGCRRRLRDALVLNS